MGHRLPGDGADIHPDIVAVWLEFLVNPQFHLVDKLPDCGFFLERGIEIFGHMPMRNHQAVPGINGISVITDEGQFILDYDSGFPAKRTIRVVGSTTQNVYSAEILRTCVARLYTVTGKRVMAVNQPATRVGCQAGPLR